MTLCSGVDLLAVYKNARACGYVDAGRFFNPVSDGNAAAADQLLNVASAAEGKRCEQAVKTH